MAPVAFATPDRQRPPFVRGPARPMEQHVGEAPARVRPVGLAERVERRSTVLGGGLGLGLLHRPDDALLVLRGRAGAWATSGVG